VAESPTIALGVSRDRTKLPVTRSRPARSDIPQLSTPPPSLTWFHHDYARHTPNRQSVPRSIIPGGCVKRGVPPRENLCFRRLELATGCYH
jgi:hypothetical protein